MSVDAHPAVHATSPQLLARARQRRAGLHVLASLTPGLVWLGLFFILPFAVIVVYSFLTRGSTGNVVWRIKLENYARVFDAQVYLTFVLRSLWMGGLTTIGWLLLDYPLALFILRRSQRWRTVLILLI